MLKSVWLAGAMLAALGATAQASPEGRGDWRTGATLVEGSAQMTPSGLMQLCDRRPELCPEYRTRYEVSKVMRQLARSNDPRVAESRLQFVDRDRLRQLREVNLTVNGMIRPRHDRGADRWDLSANEGDCEEYVLMKREVLASLGWSRSALRIAAAVTEDGEEHAVLVVRTEFEDLVLDNLTDAVLGLGAVSHRFVAAESFETPGRWSRVEAKRVAPSSRVALAPRGAAAIETATVPAAAATPGRADRAATLRLALARR